MRRKILSIICLICLNVSTFSAPAFAEDTNQSVSADTSWYSEEVQTYTLSTPAQFLGLISLTNDRKDFEGVTINLGNDLVLNDTTASDWTNALTQFEAGDDFAGTFNGNGYAIIGWYSENGLFSEVSGSISNLTLRDVVIVADDRKVGTIAASLDGNGSINSCTIDNANISNEKQSTGGVVGESSGKISSCVVRGSTVKVDSSNVGGICGNSKSGGSIEQCTVDSDTIIEGKNTVGGIVGNSTNVINECSSAATVSAESSVGGIVGAIDTGTISSCVNTGSVICTSTDGNNTGGIAGNVKKDTTFSNCTNEGSVSGTNYVGGIVGRLSTNCKVSDSTSSGSVTGTSNVGGIAGTSNVEQGTQYDQGNPNTIENCTVSAKVSGTSNVGGLLGSNSVSTDDTKEATSIKNNVLMPTASVNGTEKTGALIGDNSEMTTDSGTIINNVWSENLGSASGSGIGDASTNADSAVAKQNSSYGSDGKLNNPLPTGEGGSTINSLSDALTQLIAGGDESKVPETLKVTVTYQNNGHGAAVTGQTIVIGDEITLPAMENDGYFTFLGWSDGTTTYAAGTTVGIMKDTTFTAQWRDDTPPYTGKYSYEVFTSVGDNGSLTVDRYATEGDKVTIEVTPDEAYLLDELVVTANGKEVELTDNGDGTYTFTMPSADVRITASFAEDPDWTEPEPEEPATDVSDIFIDVAPNAWYKDAVQYAYENGLMTGVSANEFAPDATTTRGMIVSMLARLEGVESANDAGFADVSDEWYATAVNWAASVGVVNGYEDNTFRPNDAITREQLAAILMNYASYKGEDVSARADLSAYTDQPSAWAEETMSWAVAEGLITGVTNDELQPQGNATRAQVAAILQRFLCK